MSNINTLIPPGSTSSYGAPIVDSHMNIGQRLSNPNTINKRIEEKRMQDNMKRQLQNEFNIIDVNRDGQITRDELHNFFINEKVGHQPLLACSRTSSYLIPHVYLISTEFLSVVANP